MGASIRWSRQVNGGLTRPTTTFDSSQLCPTFANGKIDREGGAFVQDRWTMDRVTLSLGSAFRLVQCQPALGSLSPVAHHAEPQLRRAGVRQRPPKRLDAEGGRLMGRVRRRQDGAQGELRKYVLGQSLVASNPLIALSSSNVVTTATRTWTDNDGNFIPDCDLTNPGLQGPTQPAPQQVDTCGTVNPLFYSGLSTVTAVDPATGRTVGAGDDEARYGWEKRPYSWEFSLSAQREIGKGVSVNGGYFRRWFGNFLVTDNLSNLASDYDAYSITPSLIPPPPASAGGATLPGDIFTSGFYSPTAAAAARGVNNFVGLSDTFFPGSNVIDHWNGFDLGVNAQARRTASSSRAARAPGDRSPTTATSSIRRTPASSAPGRRSSRASGHQLGEHLPRRAGVADAGEVPRFVHRAED